MARDVNAERQRKALAGTLIRREAKKEAVKPTLVADAPVTYSAGGVGDEGEVATVSPVQTPETIAKAIDLYQWSTCPEIPLTWRWIRTGAPSLQGVYIGAMARGGFSNDVYRVVHLHDDAWKKESRYAVYAHNELTQQLGEEKDAARRSAVELFIVVPFCCLPVIP